MATAQGQQWIRLSPEKTIEFPTSGANASVTVNLKLTNVSGGYLAYKIKTTAPRNYLVRPSSGVINPQGDAIVEIILQANATGEGGPPTNDRFLVQVTPTSSNQPPARDQWTTIAKEHIQDHRLNVVFKETAGTPGNALPNGVRPPQPGGAHEDTNLPQQQQQQQGAGGDLVEPPSCQAIVNRGCAAGGSQQAPQPAAEEPPTSSVSTRAASTDAQVHHTAGGVVVDRDTVDKFWRIMRRPCVKRQLGDKAVGSLTHLFLYGSLQQVSLVQQVLNRLSELHQSDSQLAQALAALTGHLSDQQQQHNTHTV
mmetsp:Transcript_6205/g.17822  ORF Transcript_6205/g.17822 Transcript_6205/m.17822 type:complete len:310 (+) Transcript_6205:147-1076(+)